jgi:hypothetical protein
MFFKMLLTPSLLSRARLAPFIFRLLGSLGLLVGSAFATAADPAAGAPSTRWAARAAEKKALTKDVVWLSHEPLEFELRRGEKRTTDLAERYVRMLSSKNLQRMAEAGVKFNQVFFYKGFGIDYERANFERVKQAVAEMHRLGMKTSVYIGGTMFIETFYRENPGARAWERRDQDGHWIPYGTQTFRHYACINEPAYRDYIKRVVRYAVEEVKTDEVFFDNLMLQEEPQSCRCERCLAAFHEFLRKRYPTPEAARQRFGLPDVDAVWVNEWDSREQARAVTEIKDPVLQEWTRFRCESMAAYTIDLARYAKQLNPAVAVNLNLKGIYSFNRYWTNAIYHPLYADCFDFVHFDTGGHDARIDETTGALVSQIRSYKLARQLQVNCLDVIEEDDLRTAVHMAFSYQKPLPGWPGAPWHEGLNVDFTPLLEFFREYNARYFTGTREVADVAVLRTWASMAYSVHAAHEPATLVEQVLIQHKIPFALLHEEEIDGIDRYGAVVLAGQECLSQAQVDRLLRYVRAGGTLVLAGDSGRYNDWREEWSQHPLLPARTEGKGRIVHIAQVIPGLPRPAGATVNEDPEPGATLRPGVPMNPTQWVLPHNHAEIGTAVTQGLAKGLSVETSAPLTTVMELLNRDESRETMLHLINFDLKQPTAPIQVALRTQFSGKVTSVTCLSPDRDEPQALPFTEHDGRVQFTVPALRLYSLIVVAYAP